MHNRKLLQHNKFSAIGKMSPGWAQMQCLRSHTARPSRLLTKSVGSETKP
ncbi:hypothetical protein QT974_03990 [Microcoleus sp. herbarium12]